VNNKELILKRLLEANHITLEELFILNEVQIVSNEKVIIKEIRPYDTTPIPLPWTVPAPLDPYYYHKTITCKTTSNES